MGQFCHGRDETLLEESGDSVLLQGEECCRGTKICRECARDKSVARGV